MNVPAVLAAFTGLIPELVLACDHALSQIDILCPLCLRVQMVNECACVVYTNVVECLLAVYSLLKKWYMCHICLTRTLCFE